jgi:hypothetical protein
MPGPDEPSTSPSPPQARPCRTAGGSGAVHLSGNVMRSRVLRLRFSWDRSTARGSPERARDTGHSAMPSDGTVQFVASRACNALRDSPNGKAGALGMMPRAAVHVTLACG